MQPPSDAPAGLDEMVKFVVAQRGTSDISMGFDGINRKSRRLLEDAIMKLPASAEIFVTYQRPPSHWAERKHFFASKNTEVGYMALPTSRGKLSCKPRESSGSHGTGDSFSGAGEDSSHFTTYTGVPTLSRNHLAFISEEDKSAITKGAAPPELPKKWSKHAFRGTPLFWQESKTVELWARILTDAGVKCVVDITPGSGVLAEACMKIGVTYHGMLFDQTHYKWLSNVVDRVSLKYIVVNGNPLYHEDLATHLKTLFTDQIAADDDNAVQMSDSEEGE